MAHGLPPGMDGRILWREEPADVPRITDDTKDRALRLKTLGNAVCPPQAYPIFHYIAAIETWKASEKEAQKMTRDGAISVNLVTGEATHISDRPQEQDYSSADETAGTLSRAVDEVEGHVERRQAKKARRKRRDTFREGEAARDRPSSRLQFSEADRAAPELKKGHPQVGQGCG